MIKLWILKQYWRILARGPAKTLPALAYNATGNATYWILFRGPSWCRILGFLTICTISGYSTILLGRLDLHPLLHILAQFTGGAALGIGLGIITFTSPHAIRDLQLKDET